MIVDVTMYDNHAVIEDEGKKLRMSVPLLGPLKARMGGQKTAKFKAEVHGHSLELGDAVDVKYMHGPAPSKVAGT